MERADLQRISDEKIADAKLLLANGRWSNAYYLAGYAVEIGLKACAARRIVTDVIPERSFLQNVYTHDMDRLVKVAEIEEQLALQLEKRTFRKYWGAVSLWKPDSRYEVTGQDKAVELVTATADPENGVLPWIRALW